ncbi:GPP34 family phosphoprotein [Lentilactobacillus sp. IMAU92037]|uniref:GPP34 family phosphoprotein n=1 Tax=Lentilactobacillus dabitei TaxID=2831523 RepID=UPI001C256A8A|nr:GPP34 family phosphoprotein [Lentilactobacillus dabitei]MBU9790207.1 GPP34 family phosphoprotein [Lentilactobacillus dabitei]MBV0931050.1 GPP34 family phosphoprotein [Lentilactobacillus dabitei]
MMSLSYTEQFALCVLGQKPKLNAFKKREVASCLLLSEIVELLRDGSLQLTADDKMVVGPGAKPSKDYLVPVARDIQGRKLQTINSYIKNAVLSVRKKRVTEFAAALCNSLISDNMLDEDENKYYVNQTVIDRSLTELYHDLTTNKEPHEVTVMLAMLLINSGLFKSYFPKDEATQIQLRLKEVAKSDQYPLISDVIKRVHTELSRIVASVRREAI